MVGFMATDNWFYGNKPISAAGMQREDGGFTLVELISVVAIIAILAAIAIPAYGEYLTRARIARTIAEIRMLDREITGYKTEYGHLPSSLAEIGQSGLLDLWGHPYEYLNIEDGDIKGKGKLRRDRFLNPLNTDYDLYSTGADGESKTNLNAAQSRDDIVRVSNGGFIGLASNF